ncbi:hypothetical protein AB205_0201810 [Aquarana catesbeiana]|uniref:Uncharacterized protein n=1 Tax=Aquarana catesbeiana TaxID=8400 RepID=A0A2G9RVQ3_AQUCT|nr:hypothetical protein AB205_0201810 [Aquarana catesbeiana]
MTVAGTKYLMGISCCDGDGCTPSIQNSTVTSAVSNGVQCKTCGPAGSSSCETYTTMNCTGQETQCVNYTRTDMSGSTSSTSTIRGCGTKSLCDAQNLSSTMNYMTVLNNFTCESTTTPSTTTPRTTTPSTTTPSKGGNGTTNNGGNGTTNNGGSGTTRNGGNGATRNGGNGITDPSNGEVIFLLFSTLTAILILHQFN